METPLTARFGLCHIWEISVLVSKATRVSFISSLRRTMSNNVTHSSKVLPGEVCVVLVDQIFLDPEIIVAGWKEHDLLIRGVVTIPEGKEFHPKTEDFKYYCLKISIARLKNFPSYEPTMVSLEKDIKRKIFYQLEHFLGLPLFDAISSSCMEPDKYKFLEL